MRLVFGILGLACVRYEGGAWSDSLLLFCGLQRKLFRSEILQGRKAQSSDIAGLLHCECCTLTMLLKDAQVGQKHAKSSTMYSRASVVHLQPCGANESSQESYTLLGT